MRSTPDNPVDPLGDLGSPIRPATPAQAPDPAKGFELGNWGATLPDGLKPAPTPAPPPAGSDLSKPWACMER